MAAKKKPRAASPSSKAGAPVAPASLIAHLQESIAGIVEDFGPVVVALVTSLGITACSAGTATGSGPPAATGAPISAKVHAPPPPPPPPPPEMMAGSEDVRPSPPAPSGAPPVSSGAPPAPSGAHQDSGNAVVMGVPTVNPGGVPNVERVIASMRAGLRYCYDRGLAAEPSMQGHFEIKMKLASTGEVKEVTLTPAKVLSPPIRACVAARAQAARFDPPRGGATTLRVPVDFVKK